MLTAIFSIVIGALFLVVAGLQFKLHDVLGGALVFDKKLVSRMPAIDPFAEQVRFRGFFQVSAQDDTDVHYRHLRPFIEMAFKK